MMMASRNVARSTTKIVVNDSMAFHPSQRIVHPTVGQAFAFYPSNTGTATRIPKSSKIASSLTIQKSAATCGHSRSELDALFAQSRRETVGVRNTTQSRVNESFAFYPAQKESVNAGATKFSFAFYPSAGMARKQMRSTAQEASSSASSSSEQVAASDNNMSLLAAGSFAMGLLVQTGRFIGRP